MTLTTPSASATLSFASMELELVQLRSALAGELLTPDVEGYDEARLVQDITVDRRPLAIVRPANAQDVAHAVTFAREQNLELVVRSGGHSLARLSMQDDALVIDLTSMKAIQIDPVTRTARVEAGVTSGELADLAQEHGLALTTGDTSSVGFGGLVTGGGIGFMARKYGLTIDSLLSAQVVTAAGEVVTANHFEHPDLFWGIRGGGGNFGIITEFTFRLAQVGEILGGDIFLPASREVVRKYLEYSSSAPDGLSTIGNLMRVPPLPFLPEEAHGQLVLGVIVCWTGDLEEGQRAIAPLRELATPVLDSVRPMPYPDIYLSTAHQAMRHGVAIRSMFAHEISDESIDAAIAAFDQPSSPFSIVHFRGLGGQMARVSPNATAFAHRTERYLMGVIGVWLDPSEDPAPHQEWVEALWNRVRHERSGVYVNFLENEGEERLREAYPPETMARLRAVKQAYDPGNLFRSNQNIEPAATAS